MAVIQDGIAALPEDSGLQLHMSVGHVQGPGRSQKVLVGIAVNNAVIPDRPVFLQRNGQAGRGEGLAVVAQDERRRLQNKALPLFPDPGLDLRKIPACHRLGRQIHKPSRLLILQAKQPVRQYGDPILVFRDHKYPFPAHAFPQSSAGI